MDKPVYAGVGNIGVFSEIPLLIENKARVRRHDDLGGGTAWNVANTVGNTAELLTHQHCESSDRFQGGTHLG